MSSVSIFLGRDGAVATDVLAQKFQASVSRPTNCEAYF